MPACRLASTKRAEHWAGPFQVFTVVHASTGQA
jgi:hypothetical protein